jgi:hexulose-6-phosphate isomerase
MSTIGMMQGRLSPAPAGRLQQFPRDWAGELASVAAAGFSSVEWLVTAESIAHNPILSEDGAGEIQRAGARHGVSVRSLCADGFIHLPLVDASARDERLDLLNRLITAAHRIAARIVVLPFLEGNAFASMSHAATVLRQMASSLDRAADARVTLAVESDWPAAGLHALLDEAAHPSLGLCYDTGNAVSSGFDPAREIRALGSRVVEVHIKDRRKGRSVPLGEGEVDFEAVLAALDDIGFTGPLILETPAGGDPMASAIANRMFLETVVRDRQVSR